MSTRTDVQDALTEIKSLNEAAWMAADNVGEKEESDALCALLSVIRSKIEAVEERVATLAEPAA